MNPQVPPKLLARFCLGIVVAGTLTRLAPFLNQDNRLFWQYPTEDGYLMLTIARNLALGHGMSTAAGTIATNGTQPLFNLMETASFLLVGYDRLLAVALTQVLHLIFSLLGAYYLLKLTRAVLARYPQIAEPAAWLAASFWYASPLAVPHETNALETGLYATLMIISSYYWHQSYLARSATAANLKAALTVGVLLGLTFWARIDAVFFIAALTLTHAAFALSEGRSALRARLLESFVMGATSVVIASPWLINNKLRFGSLMPVSGTAQSHASTFGNNLLEIPSTVFEYMTMIVPWPNAIEYTPWAITIFVVFIAAYVAVSVMAYRKLERDEKPFFMVAALTSTALTVYYGLFFGAPHFVARYLFPMAAFTSICTAAFVLLGYERLSAFKPRRLLAFAAAGFAGLVVAGMHVRAYVLGGDHMHRQVVEWAQANVPETTWVAAVQTGTLGFFHDRTINLDGKVNPVAMEHILKDTMLDYVTTATFGPEQAQVQYIIDWYGVAGWAEKEPITTAFRVIVADEALNLAVLARATHDSTAHTTTLGH